MNTNKINKGTKGKKKKIPVFHACRSRSKHRSVLEIGKKKENQEEPMSLKGFGNLMYLLLTSAFEKQYRRATRKP